MNTKHQKIVIFGMILTMVFAMCATSQVLASGPKSIYGTLYVGGQIAPAGIDVKIKIDEQVFSKKTFTWNTCNFIIGLPPGYEGKTALFFIGVNNVVPLDNSSITIGASIEHRFDLRVNNLTQNAAPIAVIDSISPNPAAYNWTVRFVGRGNDPDGTIIGYQWRSSLQGNLSTNASFNRTNMQKGNHTIFLKVKDNNNTWSAEVSQVLRITHFNQIPKATIDSVSPQKVRVGLPVFFKGHGNDTDGTIVGYAWRSNRSGMLSDKASFNSSGLSRGNHTIFFKVMDNTSYWSEEVKSWVLVVENMPPVAKISGPTQGSVGVPIQFDGTGSYDHDGTITAWFWEFGDGTNSTIAKPTHTYTSEKTYKIRLTVTDDSKKKANTSSTIIIASGDIDDSDTNNAPGKAAITGPEQGSVGKSIEFTLVASDPDDDSVFFRIDWGDGKQTTTEFTPSNTPLTVEHAWEKAGEYTINITTIDFNYGFSPKVQYTIVISDSGFFIGGLDGFLGLFLIVIIIVVIVLAFVLLRRRKQLPEQPSPEPMFTDEYPQETYPEGFDTSYSNQAVVEPSESIRKPAKQPSAFKRI